MRTWLRWVILLLALTGLVATARAATYTYRSDTYAWESAANAVTWLNSCYGTGVAGDDDHAVINFTGGFTFPFAGVTYSSVRILTNGSLQFGAATGFWRNFTNTALPAAAAYGQNGCTSGATTNVLMGYWTDLNPSEPGSGQVTWEQKGTAPNRYVVVSWNNVFQYQTSQPYSLQIILYENGEFKYQYGAGNATGSDGTIGVQVSSSDYTQYSFNSGYNANGSAIRWYIPSATPTKVAEYRFEETTWSSAIGEVVDSTGQNPGVRVGSAAPTASGRVCRGLDIPANTTSTISAIDTAVHADVSIGPSGSMSFWYAGNQAWSSTTAAMLADATLVANRPFHLQRMARGALRLTVADTAGTTLTVSSTAQSFTAGTWTHIAATWSLRAGTNLTTLSLYINGVLAGTTTGTTNGQLDPSLGSLFFGDNRSTTITPSGGTLNSANGQLDELRLYNYALGATAVAQDMAATRTCVSPLHHLEIRHASGTGVTCSPSTLTVAACQDAACATPYTAGVTGTLNASGTVSWADGSAITIPSGSSSTTLRVQLTTPGSVVLGATAGAPVASSATTCNFGTPTCTYTAADSALLLTVPNQVAEAAGNTVTVQAVRKSDSSAQCVPAFTGARTITLGCGYGDPGSGTLPVRVGGTALNATGNASAACDAAGRAFSLTFDASGRASAALAYADAGQVSISARYSGSAATNDAGLSLSNSTTFISAPASFAFTSVTGGTIRAGIPFSATVQARNSAGAATPNFGRETAAQVPTITHTRAAPTGAGASNGTFTGSLGAFSGGSATASNLVWSEVGRLDLSASLASYLGSGLSVSGSTGTGGSVVGRFVPHHFDVSATPTCGTFSYAGQPFSVSISAMNGLIPPTRTVNYDGSAATSPAFAQAVTLSDAAALGLGSFGSTASVPASRFSAGLASVGTVTYTYTAKQSAPGSLTLRATDPDGVTSDHWAEATMPLRSGRLWLSNAYGSEKTALALPVQAQYWSGSAWILNSADACTSVPASAVARSNQLDSRGSATSAWSTSASAITLSGGRGTLTLSAPTPTGSTGSVDIALNLGSTSADQSCLASHPASTGANLPWLRTRQGSCAATWDRDPAARASFGIATPETRKTVHVRELF